MDRRADIGIFSVALVLGDGKMVQIGTGDIVECSITEDVFSYCMYGKLIFIDREGLIPSGYFNGNEGIGIEYSGGEGSASSKTQNFLIYSVNRMMQSSPTTPTEAMIVELLFVDVTYFYYAQRRYSRSWKNKEVKDIIEDILIYLVGIDVNEYKDTYKYNMESGGFKLDFIMPNWTPMQAIKYLSRIAGGLCIWNHTSNDTKASTKVGILPFNSLFDVTVNKSSLDDTLRFEDPGFGIGGDIIKDWWIEGVKKHDLKYIKGGKILGYDYDGKVFLEKLYTYGNSKEDATSSNNVQREVLSMLGTNPKQQILGAKTLFPDITDKRGHIELVGWGDENFASYHRPLTNIAVAGWARKYNVQNLLHVVLKGKDTRHAGMWLNVEAPGIGEGAGIQNPQLKGFYVVKSMTTILVKPQMEPYTHIITLMRNAYMDSKDIKLMSFGSETD